MPNESRRARLRGGGAWAELVEVSRGHAGEGEGASCAQKGVAEGDFANVLHVGVVDKVAVDEEEDGEVDLFAGEEALLLEAEALDLGKVGGDLRAERCPLRGELEG